MIDRRTGRRVSVTKRHLLGNPATSWRELGWISFGVALGAVVADYAGRMYVTRTPEGGNHPFYADDAARRIFAVPCPGRIAVQLGVGGAFLAISARMKNAGGNFAVGMAIGAFALTGLQVLNGYIMPKIFGGVTAGDEMVLGNRLYPWEQEPMQKQLTSEFEQTNKPTSEAQQGKDGRMPASYRAFGSGSEPATISPGPSDSSTGTKGTPENRARKTLSGAGTGDCGCKKMCSCPACLDAWNNGYIPPHSPAGQNGGSMGPEVVVDEVPVPPPREQRANDALLRGTPDQTPPALPPASPLLLNPAPQSPVSREFLTINASSEAFAPSW